VKQPVLVAIAALAVAERCTRSGPTRARRVTATDVCVAKAWSWPPLLTAGNPVARAGIDHTLLGTTKRTDGTVQVTYKGHPLYTYSGDSVGHVGCQHVIANGGLWLALDPNGHLNMSEPKK
jgi:hypothetical protein